MKNLKEVPRAVEVVVGEYGLKGFRVFVMVGYDVKSGDSWASFPPKDGCVPRLVGEPPKLGPDFLHTCDVEWETEDRVKHRGKIQVTPR